MFEKIFFVLELMGTIVFALTGGFAAIESGLDYFGIIVISLTTAVGGGAIRDLILGINPPSMFTNFVYVITGFVSVLILLFVLNHNNNDIDKSIGKKYMNFINYIDAIGLAIFTVVGINTAVNNGHTGMFLSVFVGVLTAVGGGILRDVLIRRTPAVLVRDIYAVASLMGGVVYYVLYIKTSINVYIAMIIGMFVIFFIRIFTLKKSIHLPSTANNKHH